ncbi:MAG TPA: hypothetical protein VJA44_05800 [Acidimicrobiia bacterium]|nr:hypothetical protein [Acidimicrobiia bacterium]
MRRLAAAASLFAISAAACGGGPGSTGPDLAVERRIGYAVIVEERPDGRSIGFAEDRDVASGEEFDVSDAIWRIDDGPWNEPPATCLGRGRRIELGLSRVQNADRPGLLKDRVVWVACLAPED